MDIPDHCVHDRGRSFRPLGVVGDKLLTNRRQRSALIIKRPIFFLPMFSGNL